MTRIMLSLGFGLALAACNNAEPTTNAGPTDDSANLPAEAKLPPAIRASKTFRCADSSVVHVDWLDDGKSATVRPEKDGAHVALTSAEPGQPMTAADGSTLTGAIGDASISLGLGGKPAQRCKG